MDRQAARALLDGVAAGTVAPETALTRIAAALDPGVAELGFARIDTARALRTGDPEVVFGAGKTPEQAVAAVGALACETTQPVLVTRAGPAMRDALVERFPGTTRVNGTTVMIGEPAPPRGTVMVVSAGTSDAAVAGEAALTVTAFGAAVTELHDVGVAGLHRLLAHRDDLAAADCLVVVAGMEGALPSVVGGLVGVPIVAVPTSVGYGAALGGLAALLGMLTSCAPGVVVSNIDNGFGAGVHAARVARRVGVPGGGAR